MYILGYELVTLSLKVFFEHALGESQYSSYDWRVSCKKYSIGFAILIAQKCIAKFSHIYPLKDIAVDLVFLHVSGVSSGHSSLYP